MEETSTYHVPVLLKESIDGLNVRPDGIYVDVTFGGGGHSRELLRRMGEGTGHLYGFDQDQDAEKNLEESTSPLGVDGTGNDAPAMAGDKRFTFVRSNFRYLKNWMRYYGVPHIDGLLADLGVSSHHFDDAERGFSFRFNAPLDMRMNKRAGQNAADVLNKADEAKLADIFYLYGELKQSRRIAAAVVKARAQHDIVSTQDFIDVVSPMMPRDREKKDMAKLFQALRIEVNQEMTALREMMLAATSLLRPGGRLVVITYHSLEDRMVKNIMRSGNAEGRQQQDFFGRVASPFRMVSNKVITPTEEELQ
nr:16S rRNA (cytosine(1402)-N(4))-methyltransferase RsmH [Prevotella sp.]